MKTYRDFEEIEYDLKKLNLERKIAYEELKGVKQDLKDSMSPIRWVGSFTKAISKYGLFILLKKIFK